MKQKQFTFESDTFLLKNQNAWQMVCFSQKNYETTMKKPFPAEENQYSLEFDKGRYINKESAQVISYQLCLLQLLFSHRNSL